MNSTPGKNKRKGSERINNWSSTDSPSSKKKYRASLCKRCVNMDFSVEEAQNECPCQYGDPFENQDSVSVDEKAKWDGSDVLVDIPLAAAKRKDESVANNTSDARPFTSMIVSSTTETILSPLRKNSDLHPHFQNVNADLAESELTLSEAFDEPSSFGPNRCEPRLLTYEVDEAESDVTLTPGLRQSVSNNTLAQGVDEASSSGPGKPTPTTSTQDDHGLVVEEDATSVKDHNEDVKHSVLSTTFVSNAKQKEVSIVTQKSSTPTTNDIGQELQEQKGFDTQKKNSDEEDSTKNQKQVTATVHESTSESDSRPHLPNAIKVDKRGGSRQKQKSRKKVSTKTTKRKSIPTKISQSSSPGNEVSTTDPKQENQQQQKRDKPAKGIAKSKPTSYNKSKSKRRPRRSSKKKGKKKASKIRDKRPSEEPEPEPEEGNDHSQGDGICRNCDHGVHGSECVVGGDSCCMCANYKALLSKLPLDMKKTFEKVLDGDEGIQESTSMSKPDLKTWIEGTMTFAFPPQGCNSACSSHYHFSWKSEEMEIPKATFDKLPLDEAKKHLLVQSKILEILTDPQVRVQDKEKAKQIFFTTLSLLKELYDQITFQPVTAKPGKSGLYIAKLRNYKLVKIGMSDDLKTRSKYFRNSLEWMAAVNVNENAVIESSMKRCMDSIVSLQPMMLETEDWYRERKLERVKYQLLEAVLAAMVQTCTKTTMEELLLYPSLRVQESIYPKVKEVFEEKHIDFFQGVKKVHQYMTWAHLPGHLMNLSFEEAVEYDWLRALIRQMPEGQHFLKLFMDKKLYPNSSFSYEDVVDCPAALKLRDLVRVIDEFLTSDEKAKSSKTTFLKWLEDLSKTNYNYLACTEEELAAGILKRLKTRLKNDAPKDAKRTMINIEMCMVKACTKHFPGELNKLLKLEDTMELAGGRIMLLHSRISKHKVLFAPSYFVALTHENDDDRTPEENDESDDSNDLQEEKMDEIHELDDVFQFEDTVMSKEELQKEVEFNQSSTSNMEERQGTTNTTTMEMSIDRDCGDKELVEGSDVATSVKDLEKPMMVDNSETLEERERTRQLQKQRLFSSRINVSKAFCVHMDLLAAVYAKNPNHNLGLEPDMVEKEKKLLCTYLSWKDRGYSHRFCKTPYLPQEYSQTQVSNTKQVSRFLGTSVAVSLYIRLQLGKEKFNRMLWALGMKLNDDPQTRLCPFDCDFECPGIPEIPNVSAAISCCHDEEKNGPRTFWRFGALYTEILPECFQGIVTCQSCHKRVRKKLEQYLKAKGHLDEDQKVLSARVSSECTKPGCGNEARWKDGLCHGCCCANVVCRNPRVEDQPRCQPCITKGVDDKRKRPTCRKPGCNKRAQWKDGLCYGHCCTNKGCMNPRVEDKDDARCQKCIANGIDDKPIRKRLTCTKPGCDKEAKRKGSPCHGHCCTFKGCRQPREENSKACKNHCCKTGNCSEVIVEGKSHCEYCLSVGEGRDDGFQTKSSN